MYNDESKPVTISHPTNFKHIAHISWDTERRTYKTDNNKTFEEIFNIQDRAVIDKQINDYCDEQAEQAEVKENTENVEDTQETAAPDETNVETIEISNPSNFNHITHISWGPDKDFVVKTNDEQLAQFFKQADINTAHMEDRSTREFIFDFIQQHGGELMEIGQTEHTDMVSEPLIGQPSEFTHVTKCVYNKDKKSYDIETKDKHLSWFYERARSLKEQKECKSNED